MSLTATLSIVEHIETALLYMQLCWGVSKNATVSRHYWYFYYLSSVNTTT